MVSSQQSLTPLLKRLSSPPTSQKKLDELVKNALETSKPNKPLTENQRSQWECLLKTEVFKLAVTEGKALKDKNTLYYDRLRDLLDLILTFTERDACDQNFPFQILEDLFETQTISSCSHIFSWLESRAPRLTVNMQPQKGKALILLRMLNDLLRRLSKMGSTTIFCGRILTFLSAVFPLGERSGVNLRGEYGPVWEGVQQKAAVEEKVKDEKEKEKEKTPEKDVADDTKMQVDEEAKKPSEVEKKKEDFYNTFWSLQLPFSRPPLFAAPNTFSEFKDAVNKVLPVIKEATAKERAMMGSRATGAAGSLKRKRERDPTEEPTASEYFFAKFLTSPDLLDLEIADTHFRRQFLFQLLILLNHLLGFTKSSKVAWTTSRNRSLQMDFTLETADGQWIQETIGKVSDELRQTTPNGRAFLDTVLVILEREKNWVKWKNELCSPFDKEPWSTTVDGRKVGLLEATKEVRKKMREPPKEWEWKLGSQPLTEIWDMGYRDLRDLEVPFQPGEVKDFVKKVKLEDHQIALRRKQLERQRAAKAPPPPRAASPPGAVASSASGVGTGSPAPVVSSDSTTQQQAPETSPTPAPSSGPSGTVSPAPASSVPEPTFADDEKIVKYEENKQRWAWLALRTARDLYLQHFGKIGTGDIELLLSEIEKEKAQPKSVTRAPLAATPVREESEASAMAVDTRPEEDVKVEGGAEGA